MMTTGLRVLRVGFRVAWVAGVAVLIGLVALPQLLSGLDRQMYVVRGGSMEPAVPLGSVVIIHHVDPTGIRPGDVVSFRIASGAVVTHRVLGAAMLPSGQVSLATKGDANLTGDPVTVPGAAVIGRVEYVVPVLGYLLNTLGSTSGMLLTLGILGTLLVGGWFIDELARTLRPAAARGTVAEPAI